MFDENILRLSLIARMECEYEFCPRKLEYNTGRPVPGNNGYKKMGTLVLRSGSRSGGKFEFDFTKSSLHHLIVFIAQNIYFL